MPSKMNQMLSKDESVLLVERLIHRHIADYRCLHWLRCTPTYEVGIYIVLQVSDESVDLRVNVIATII